MKAKDNEVMFYTQEITCRDPNEFIICKLTRIKEIYFVDAFSQKVHKKNN